MATYAAWFLLYRIAPEAAAVFLCAVIALPTLTAVAVLLFDDFIPRRLLKFVPVPRPSDVFPVRIFLLNHRQATGMDEGVLFFHEGWLSYEGRRTAFSILAKDVEEFIEIGSRRIRLGLNSGQELRITAFDSFDLPEEKLTRLRAHLVDRIHVWNHFREEDVEGESMLPPLEPHGSACLTRFGFWT